MYTDYLLSDELDYELTIRGYPAEGTVAEKRKRLRPALRMEKEGVVFSIKADLNPEEEIEIVAKKVDDLKASIDSFNYDNAANDYKRYSTRLWHVMGRINRINFGEDEARKGRLLIRCGEISDFLEESIFLLQPIRVPEFPSVVPTGSGNTSVENMTTNTNPVASPPTNTDSREQSRNVSLIDVEPRDLGMAIDHMQINNPLLSSPTPVTQTFTTTNAPGTRTSPIRPNVICPQTVIGSSALSGPSFIPGQYVTAGARPVAQTFWSQPFGPVGQYQYPNAAFQLQPDLRTRGPMQPQSNLHTLSCPVNPLGVDLTSAAAGNPPQRVGFRGLPDVENNGPNSGMGAGMEQLDRLRTFKTVSQWNVKFDGLTGVNNFLEGVEELRTACGISKAQLMGAAIVLFQGVALDWFRANMSSSHSWDNLVAMLRSAFLPGGYEEDLWSDIRARTQGQSERATTYVSVMQNLFNKLTERPNEQTRLQIIRRNLLPHIQGQLALMDFSNLSDLTVACQRVEDTQTRMDRFKPPPTNPMVVTERELMYNPRRYRQQVNTVDVPPTPSASQTRVPEQPQPTPSVAQRLSCWNCRQFGHLKRDCTQRRSNTKHCFGCGNPNYTRATCPRCSGNVGVTH